MHTSCCCMFLLLGALFCLSYFCFSFPFCSIFKLPLLPLAQIDRQHQDKVNQLSFVIIFVFLKAFYSCKPVFSSLRIIQNRVWLPPVVVLSDFIANNLVYTQCKFSDMYTHISVHIMYITHISGDTCTHISTYQCTHIVYHSYQWTYTYAHIFPHISIHTHHTH